MTDQGSEYGRLLAERDRLVGAGVDPDALDLPVRPPLDPDPLSVGLADRLDQLEHGAGWTAGYDEGYERGVLNSGRSGVVVALLLVAITAAILGGMVGWAIGMGMR